MLIRDARIFADLTSTNYRRSPLVQGGLEIPCRITIQMSPTHKNAQLLDRLIELVEAVYTEPTSPEIMGSFLADEIEVDFEAEAKEQIPKTGKSEQKKKTVKPTRSYDIRDMFRGRIPKKPRIGDNILQGKESTDIVIIDD